MSKKNQVTAGQIRKFLDLLDQKGVTSDVFQKRLTSAALADLFDPAADLEDYEAWRLALKLGIVMPDIFKLTVDYALSLEDMIALGNYDGSPYGHEQDLVISGKGKIDFEARYFDLGPKVLPDEVLTAIAKEDTKNPWSPASPEHLLAHGAKFPHEQRKFDIVGLGYYWRTKQYKCVDACCLSMDGDPHHERRFKSVILPDGMSWLNERTWGRKTLFLAVRQVK